MAGLLGDSFNYVDPGVGLAAGLLSGRGNLGANLALGLGGGQQAAQANRQFALTQQAAERANRQNDLQQLMGLYGILKNQDAMQAYFDSKSGRPHVPVPGLSEIEQKMGGLLGMPPLSSGAASPGQSPSLGAGGLTAPTPASPMQPPQLGAQPSPPMPAPQGQGVPTQPPMSQAGRAIQDQLDMADMQAFLAGKPDLVAQNLYQRAKPISTRYGIYVPNPNDPAQALLAGGMMPQNALNLTPGPNGPTVAPIPGQADTIKQIVNAQQAGKAPYDIKMIPTASGAVVPMSVAQLAGEARKPPVPSAAAEIPPEVAAAAARGPFEATQAPGGPVQFRQQTADPFADIPKRYQPQGLGQTTFDKEMASKQAESASALATKLGTEADAANQRIALNTQASKLVDQADTGPKAATLGDVKNWLVSRVGIPESAFKNTPSATIALQKDLLNAATQRAKQQFGSRITQSEVMLMLTRGSPNVDMTKASIKYLIDSDTALQQYQIKQANDFGTYLQRGGDPMRFESWYASKFPATTALGQVHLKSEMQPSGQSKTVRFQDLP